MLFVQKAGRDIKYKKKFGRKPRIFGFFIILDCYLEEIICTEAVDVLWLFKVNFSEFEIVDLTQGGVGIFLKG